MIIKPNSKVDLSENDDFTPIDSDDLIFKNCTANGMSYSFLRSLFKQKLLWKNRNRIVFIVNDTGAPYQELGTSDSKIGKFIPWLFRNTHCLKAC